MNELLVKEALKLLEMSRTESDADEARDLVERAIGFIKVALDEADKYKSFYEKLGVGI